MCLRRRRRGHKSRSSYDCHDMKRREWRFLQGFPSTRGSALSSCSILLSDPTPSLVICPLKKFNVVRGSLSCGDAEMRRSRKTSKAAAAAAECSPSSSSSADEDEVDDDDKDEPGNRERAR